MAVVYWIIAIVAGLGILLLALEKSARALQWFNEECSEQTRKALSTLVLNVWTTFWMALIAISPLVWQYLLFDLEWFASGQVVADHDGNTIHPAGALAAVLLDLVFLVLAFAPWME
jgi:hypothetical protein